MSGNQRDADGHLIPGDALTCKGPFPASLSRWKPMCPYVYEAG